MNRGVEDWVEIYAVGKECTLSGEGDAKAMFDRYGGEQEPAVRACISDMDNSVDRDRQTYTQIHCQRSFRFGASSFSGGGVVV